MIADRRNRFAPGNRPRKTWVLRSLSAAALALTPMIATAQSLCFCPACLNPAIENLQAVSGDMKPTLEPGICLRGLRVSDPTILQPGDLLFFERENGQIFISRLIATAGQTVAMTDGRLAIDGQMVPAVPAPPYRQIAGPEGPQALRGRCPEGQVAPCDITVLRESLGNRTYATLDLGPSPFDTFGPVTVPEAHVFVISDHRDNAVDSRLPAARGGPGAIPLANVLGRIDIP